MDVLVFRGNALTVLFACLVELLDPLHLVTGNYGLPLFTLGCEKRRGQVTRWALIRTKTKRPQTFLEFGLHHGHLLKKVL